MSGGSAAARASGFAGFGSAPLSGARPASGALVLPGFAALLGYATFAQGAFYWPQALTLALGSAALGWASRRALGREVAAPALAFTALGAGLVASAAANGWPAGTRLPLAGLVTAAGALAAARSLVIAGERDRIIETLSVLGAVVGTVGLLGLAFHAFPWAMEAQGIWRASSTLTYANAAGAMLALMLPATLVLLRNRTTPASRIAAYLTVAGMLATLSRGALLGVVAMLAILAALGEGSLLRALARPGAGAILALAALMPSVAGGASPILGLAGIVGGAAIAAYPLRGARRERHRRALARVAAGAAAAALVGAAVLAASGGGRAVGSRALSEDRLRFWRGSIAAASEHPVFGTGPGTYRLTEIRGGRQFIVRYAHNEYLQALVETGAVGLAAILAAVALLGAWAWRARPAGTERTYWAVGIAACSAFLVHGFFDFMWRLPALIAVAFTWLALAASRPRAKEGGSS